MEGGSSLAKISPSLPRSGASLWKSPMQTPRGNEDARSEQKASLKICTTKHESLLSREECELLVHECSWVKCTMSNRSGYSPAQRVLGKNPVLNLDLTGDGMHDYQLSANGSDDHAFERAM